MQRLKDDVARLQEDVKSRVLFTSTQLAEFKLNRASDTARDSRERAMFVVENSLSVNRMLKEFHDSRIANGQQERAERIAFVSNMVKKRAEFLEELSATRKERLKDITNKSPKLKADKATSVTASNKDGKRHSNQVATDSQGAIKQSERAMDAQVVTSQMNTERPNTSSVTAPKASAPVTPKTTAPVTAKTAEPIPDKVTAPLTAKTAEPVSSKAAASVTSKPVEPVVSKAPAPVAPETAAPVTPKSGSLSAPKATSSGTPKAAAAAMNEKSKRNR
jgi:hypothetical protein|tara:strand:- start:3917 stop:4744 length:828 start_codon:yes stop_codon:yes gene_type:complete